MKRDDKALQPQRISVDTGSLMVSMHHGTRLLSPSLHSVLVGEMTVGFVHRVGHVYVALSGDRLDCSVEVGQSLIFRRAVDQVYQHNDEATHRHDRHPERSRV